MNFVLRSLTGSFAGLGRAVNESDLRTGIEVLHGLDKTSLILIRCMTLYMLPGRDIVRLQGLSIDGPLKSGRQDDDRLAKRCCWIKQNNYVMGCVKRLRDEFMRD